MIVRDIQGRINYLYGEIAIIKKMITCGLKPGDEWLSNEELIDLRYEIYDLYLEIEELEEAIKAGKEKVK